uniref:Uncharacterized protein n=1 Tax=Calcidiscus leptoporus TaxID=127549 RepID=A0A7S0NVY9_9EUKA|mmetsp:Transcript_31118/g.72365  ORF Transcript_31118/g.72365 Transcript_31118/m.72365 type:complete len:150 (+) Transcript_31118:1-450(+)
MRSSARYLKLLDRFATGHANVYIGYLGDQTLYTHMEFEAPRIFARLGCEWNRQISLQFGFSNATVHKCPRQCGILHANYGPLKCVAALMQRSPSCETWQAFQASLRTSKTCPRALAGGQRVVLQKAIRDYMSDCCMPQQQRNSTAAAVR